MLENVWYEKTRLPLCNDGNGSTAEGGGAGGGARGGAFDTDTSPKHPWTREETAMVLVSRFKLKRVHQARNGKDELQIIDTSVLPNFCERTKVDNDA